MQYLAADYILPSDGRVLNKHVLVLLNNGQVENILPLSEAPVDADKIKHYQGILCPGFVNTHCHLELSWARDLIPEKGGLDAFIRQLEIFRKNVSEEQILKAIEEEDSRMAESGIVAVADIANTDATLRFKANSTIFYHTLVESFGSDPSRADAAFEKVLSIYSEFKANSRNNAASIVPHATYSLSAPLLKYVTAFAKQEDGLLSIHHQETQAENQFFADGTGSVAERRKLFTQDIPEFVASDKRPMESLAGYFAPDRKILFVHNTFSEQSDIDFIENYFSSPYWCFCPNANLFIENRLPDIPLFRQNGCKITLGTDSLASNHQLNLLEEIKTVQSHFPEIPLTEILQWVTLNGADFLGISSKAGSFEKGKNPGVVLIENADLDSFRILPESKARLLIHAQI